MSDKHNPGKEQEPDYFSQADDDLLNALKQPHSGISDVPPPVTHRRRIDWGSVGSWIFWLALLGGGAWWLAHHLLTQARERHTAEIRQQQQEAAVKAAITALALKYNAVTNWTAALPDRGWGERFSIDVSRALIRSNGQPVVMMMDLKDVAENNGGCTAMFASDSVGITHGSFGLSVELRCTQEQANQLFTTTGNGRLQPYAVVARVDKLVRPKFKASSSWDGEDSSIDMEASSDVFLVNGELLEAIPLPRTKTAPLSAIEEHDYEPDPISY